MSTSPDQAKPGSNKFCDGCLHEFVCADTGKCTRSLPPLNPNGQLAKAFEQMFGMPENTKQ